MELGSSFPVEAAIFEGRDAGDWMGGGRFEAVESDESDSGED